MILRYGMASEAPPQTDMARIEARLFSMLYFVACASLYRFLAKEAKTQKLDSNTMSSEILGIECGVPQIPEEISRQFGMNVISIRP
jgi:hypothetical protein